MADKEINAQQDDQIDSKLDTREVGKRLKAIRRSRDFTQAKMGEILNCKQATISAYEDGRIVPSLHVVYKVAKEFNIDLNWLIKGDMEEGTPSSYAGFQIREDLRSYGKKTDAEEEMEKMRVQLADVQKMLIDLQKEYINIIKHN